MSQYLESNARAVIRALAALPDCLSPRARLPGGRRLGDEMADTIAEAVRYRTVEQQRQPDGSPLPPLNRAYRRHKMAQGHDGRILVRTGEMLEARQLRGRVTATSDRLIMEGGLDPETAKKMGWATRGDKNRNRPKRLFYEAGRSGEKALMVVLREAAKAAVAHARFS